MAAKIFEVNDVLPVTTQLRISWTETDGFSGDITSDLSPGTFYIVFGGWPMSSVCGIDVYDGDDGVWLTPYTAYGGNHAYMDVDTTSWPLSKRTISSVDTDKFTWENLNPGYTITFNSNGGTTISDITEATELPSTLPTPTKSGYTFVNWYYDSSFTQKATAGDTIESNVTLYAKWHNLGSLFTEIADAIRSKDGTSGTIRDVDFGERVKQIQGAKEEETKVVTPNFSSGNEVVTPTSGKVLSQVTINKDSNLIADNIKKDITVHGITGTLQPAKEEQTKTVSPTTSSQDVLPDANKVLSKVTVNAIPTETKSQQPNLSSGDQTINATSGKFMTSFTITKDTVNHIASNIRNGKTLYGVAGNLQPAKEEETKTLEPDFSGGNQVITPTSGKVMTSVTLTKPSGAEAKILDGETLMGIVGTGSSGGGGYTVTFTKDNFDGYSYTNGGIHYSFDNGVTYHPISDVRSVITDSWEIVPAKLMGVTQIRFKIVAKNVYNLWASVGSVLTPSRQSGNWSAESSNITLSGDVTYELEWWED